MAAVELSVLLFALIDNIHAEDLIVIQQEGNSFTFTPIKSANFCLISRLVGEEKLVLWNISDPWSNNSTVPEDLKQRLSVDSSDSISSYVIHNLTHSDSGQYQEECWTDGKVTYKENISITICSKIGEIKLIEVGPGQVVDVLCEGAADDLDIQWLMMDHTRREDSWSRVFEDTKTLVIDNEKMTSALRVSNGMIRDEMLYMCLVMNQQQCVSGHPVYAFITLEIILRSVEEAAVLPCSVSDSSDDQPPLWTKMNSETETELGRNYSLSFPSLTLNHTGLYYCGNFSGRSYLLVVCPTFGPPVVEFFSEGDEVTLKCRYLGEGMDYLWLIKSSHTEGRIFPVIPEIFNLNLSRVSLLSRSTLVISNASLEHTGEYWCAVIRSSDDQCVSATKTVLKLRESVGIHSTFYIVRSSLLSWLLLVLCAVVVAVIQRTRREAEG